MITANQLRAARALLDVSQTAIAQTIGVSANTISNIEKGLNNPSHDTLLRIQNYFEMNGVEFTDGEGIKRHQEKVISYEGTDGFRKFMDDVYEVASTQGGEICLMNAKPDNWIKWLGKEWYDRHTLRMQSIVKKINFKVTIRHGDYNFIGGKHSEYRWISEDLWNEQSFYAYGDRIGFLNFEEDSLQIFVLKQKQFTDSYRKLFNIAWDQVTALPDAKGYKPDEQ